MNTSTSLKVALTGGVASGKSTVAAAFAHLAVPIIDSDVLAREVVLPGEPALQALVDHFGQDILDRSGQLDRPRMRTRIFNDPAAKQAIEAILHPAIRARHEALAIQFDQAPYQLHVVPLLIETGTQHRYDRILVVDCLRQTQLDRLIQRDGITPGLAEQMLSAQADRTTRLAAATEVIDNQAALNTLPARVAELHQHYLELAQADNHT